MINKIMKTVSILLLIILFAVPAMARRDRGNGLPHGKWWNNKDVAARLKLSDKEIQKLENTYVDHRKRVIKLRAELEEEQFELNNLIDSRTLDEEAILKQARKLESARSTLSSEQFQFFLDVRKLLGFDRYQELKTMYQSLRRKMYNRLKEKRYKRYGESGDFRPSYDRGLNNLHPPAATSDIPEHPAL